MCKILTSQTGGRLGNQLYFILQAFILSQNGESWKYCQHPTQFNPFSRMVDFIKKLNLKQYATVEMDCISGILPFNNYFQRINLDFSEKQIDEFIKETILKVITPVQNHI